jgi:D-alanine-D-alanine ligase
MSSKRRLKICTLQSSYEGSNAPFKNYDLYCDPSPYLPEHEWSKVFVRKATAVQQIRDLVKEGFDVFVNLCDGAWDEDRAGKEVVEALERFGAAYTGADLNFYEPSKETMKMVALYNDVKTPPFKFAFNQADIDEAAKTLKFPLIVKHFNGYSSIGMTKDSRCTTPEGLNTQAWRFINEFGGALIEEFIDGREFTCLVAENPEDPKNPIAFKPVECVFDEGPTGFKHFELKWAECNKIKWIPCSEPVLEQKIKEMTKKIFVALDGVSYGRCDLRVNKEGEVFFLEINPNCGIFYPTEPPEAMGSADFILVNDPIGHRGFLKHIIDWLRSFHLLSSFFFEQNHHICFVTFIFYFFIEFVFRDLLVESICSSRFHRFSHTNVEIFSVHFCDNKRKNYPPKCTTAHGRGTAFTLQKTFNPGNSSQNMKKVRLISSRNLTCMFSIFQNNSKHTRTQMFLSLSLHILSCCLFFIFHFL